MTQDYSAQVRAARQHQRLKHLSLSQATHGNDALVACSQVAQPPIGRSRAVREHPILWATTRVERQSNHQFAKHTSRGIYSFSTQAHLTRMLTNEVWTPPQLVFSCSSEPGSLAAESNRRHYDGTRHASPGKAALTATSAARVRRARTKRSKMVVRADTNNLRNPASRTELCFTVPRARNVPGNIGTISTLHRYIYVVPSPPNDGICIRLPATSRWIRKAEQTGQSGVARAQQHRWSVDRGASNPLSACRAGVMKPCMSVEGELDDVGLQRLVRRKDEIVQGQGESSRGNHV